MSQTILSQMLDKLQFLNLEELQQLHRAVQNRLIDNEAAAKQAAFHQALVNSGLVRQIKQSSYQLKERKLIQVKGEPISNTIVEERR
ncbi:hypothetical protein [Scytonema millei]|uniref:Uncharacterized protein n=1 Tax=Scytonema millei VB511283 TaxID=1245923 RepID=A0A9X5E3L0_9CYAN|nr:hypothetical protein [Scytonema millei]NHC33589.1 hypothetical protein [Scytonema millei VB511283]